jgi:hypothetical protein
VSSRSAFIFRNIAREEGKIMKGIIVLPFAAALAIVVARCGATVLETLAGASGPGMSLADGAGCCACPASPCS